MGLLGRPPRPAWNWGTVDSSYLETLETQGPDEASLLAWSPSRTIRSAPPFD